MRMQRTRRLASLGRSLRSLGSPLMRRPLGAFMTWRCVWIAALLSCGASCRTATFTGGTFYYPPGSSREDSEYRLVVQMVGAPGKAYTDRTEKTIALAVRRDAAVVLGDKHYRAVAGDLHCAVVWDQPDD